MENFQPTGNAPVPAGEMPDLTNFPAPESTDVFLAPPPELPAEEQTNWKQFGFDLLETILLAVILYFGINALSARVRVDGFSMIPTLQDGEYVLVSKVSYLIGKPQHGDIIVFEFPGAASDQDLIKRIVGLSGDVVEVRAKVVYINGQPISEPYIAAPPNYSGSWEVPDGFLFVLGDNRNDSSDSHAWGLLPVGNVVGKAILIYWPPPEWNMINHFELVVATPGAAAVP